MVAMRNLWKAFHLLVGAEVEVCGGGQKLVYLNWCGTGYVCKVW